MLDISKTVRRRDRIHPRLDLGLLDLLGEATRAAHQVMMVMVRRALAVQGFAVGGAQRVDATVVREALERAVHGRKAHALSLDVEVFEDLLGAAEVTDTGQLIEDRLTLLRHALHGVPFLMIRPREREVRAPDAGCGRGLREACAPCGYGPQ